MSRLFSAPRTRAGLGALALLGLHVFFMLLWRLGPRFGAGGGGETFFSNPWHAAFILLAGATAIAAGPLALFALIRRRERSILLYPVIVYALFVAAFALGEVLSPH